MISLIRLFLLFFISYFLFAIDQNIFKGGHGEIWRGRKITKDGIIDKTTSYILKRMHIYNRPDILRCALREIYFGRRLRGVHEVARYVTNFVIVNDYWLVFRDEGVSLQKLLYVITMSEVRTCSYVLIFVFFVELESYHFVLY